jgi:hypothetical protein
MTLRQYQAEVNRVCAQVVKVSQRKRLQVLREELASLPASYREPALQLIATTVELTGDNMTMQKWEKITMIAAGAATVAVLLSIAVLLPQPTDFQIFVFRIVLAIGVSAFACVIPGFLNLESRSRLLALRAGGALAVFVLVYLWNPPQLVRSSKQSLVESSHQPNSLTGIIQTNR